MPDGISQENIFAIVESGQLYGTITCVRAITGPNIIITLLLFIQSAQMDTPSLLTRLAK